MSTMQTVHEDHVLHNDFNSPGYFQQRRRASSHDYINELKTLPFEYYLTHSENPHQITTSGVDTTKKPSTTAISLSKNSSQRSRAASFSATQK